MCRYMYRYIIQIQIDMEVWQIPGTAKYFNVFLLRNLNVIVLNTVCITGLRYLLSPPRGV